MYGVLSWEAPSRLRGRKHWDQLLVSAMGLRLGSGGLVQGVCWVLPAVYQVLNICHFYPCFYLGSSLLPPGLSSTLGNWFCLGLACDFPQWATVQGSLAFWSLPLPLETSGHGNTVNLWEQEESVSIPLHLLSLGSPSRMEFRGRNVLTQRRCLLPVPPPSPPHCLIQEKSPGLQNFFEHRVYLL